MPLRGPEAGAALKPPTWSPAGRHGRRLSLYRHRLCRSALQPSSSRRATPLSLPRLPRRSARASLSVCVTAASGSCIVHATLVLLYICCFLFVAVNSTSVGIRKRPSRLGLHTANSSSIDRFCTRRRLCLKCPACAIAVETVLFYYVLLLTFVKNIRSRTRVYSLHRCVMCFPEFACPCGW